MSSSFLFLNKFPFLSLENMFGTEVNRQWFEKFRKQGFIYSWELEN